MPQSGCAAEINISETGKALAVYDPTSLDEANHRITNNLQMLVALMSIEARRIADPDARATIDLMINRIGAIASVHRQLYCTRDGGAVDLGVYLSELAQDLDLSGSGFGRPPAISVEPASVIVSADEASAVGMIVSELVGNARKYAYEPGAPAPVRIVLRERLPAGYSLEVSDKGRGLSLGSPAAGTGFGTRLIDMMARKLGAEHAWHDGVPGTRFTLSTGQA